MNRRSLLIGAGGAALIAGAGALGWRAGVGPVGAYEAYADRLRISLPEPAGIEDLVRFATLAANSHNTQPWRFRVAAGAIDILPDRSRSTPAVDPDDHHLFVSLGCAAENLAIAGAASGRPGTIAVLDDGGVRYTYAASAPRPDPLMAAIARRQTTRAIYDGRPVPAAIVVALLEAANVPGVRTIVLTERARIDRIRDLVVAANDAQIADAAFVAELKAWLRFNPRSAMARGDGLYAGCTQSPLMPDSIGRWAFDAFFSAAAEREKYARHVDSSAGIAVFVAERADRAHWIAVGRACQRFALTATKLGLKHAFINQPVEVARLRPELASTIGEPGLRPDLVLRFGYGPTLPYAPRRPPAAVTEPA